MARAVERPLSVGTVGINVTVMIIVFMLFCQQSIGRTFVYIWKKEQYILVKNILLLRLKLYKFSVIQRLRAHFRPVTAQFSLKVWRNQQAKVYSESHQIALTYTINAISRIPRMAGTVKRTLCICAVGIVMTVMCKMFVLGRYLSKKAFVNIWRNKRYIWTVEYSSLGSHRR